MFRILIFLCCLYAYTLACENQPHIQNSYCDSAFVAYIRISSWNNKDAIIAMSRNKQDFSGVDYIYNGSVVMVKKNDSSSLEPQTEVELIAPRPARLCQGRMSEDLTYLIFGKYLGGNRIEVHRGMVIFTNMVNPENRFATQMREIENSQCVCEVRSEAGGGSKPACIVTSHESKCEWKDGVCLFENSKCTYHVSCP